MPPAVEFVVGHAVGAASVAMQHVPLKPIVVAAGLAEKVRVELLILAHLLLVVLLLFALIRRLLLVVGVATEPSADGGGAHLEPRGILSDE